jgi:hypothetical protein
MISLVTINLTRSYRSLFFIGNALMHRTMLSASLNGRDIPGSNNPISEMFCRVLVTRLRRHIPSFFLSSAYLLIIGFRISKISCSLTEDLILSDWLPLCSIPIKFIQTFTVIASSKHQIVCPRRFADTSKLCHPGSSTAIGASRHPHNNAGISKPRLYEGVLQLCNKRREISLTLGHGQAATSTNQWGDQGSCTLERQHRRTCAQLVRITQRTFTKKDGAQRSSNCQACISP